MTWDSTQKEDQTALVAQADEGRQMVYLDYDHCKRLYESAQEAYEAVLMEKEELFAKTLPKSARADKERITGGTKTNAFDAYIIEKERKQIDERIAEARSLMMARHDLLVRKENEIRESRETIDAIYVMRYIDHLKVSKIARKQGYSKSQVYRIIESIDQNIKMRQNAKK